MQLVHEVQKFMNKMSEPEQFQGRIIFMSMFNDIIWGIKDNEKECVANSTLVFICKMISSRTLVIPRTWIRNNVAFYLQRKMIKLGESGHPVFLATSPLSRRTLKSKGGGKLSFHFCADGDTIETVIRTIISVNKYGETRVGRAI